MPNYQPASHMFQESINVSDLRQTSQAPAQTNVWSDLAADSYKPTTPPTETDSALATVALASTSALTGIGMNLIAESPVLGSVMTGTGMLGAAVSSLILNHDVLNHDDPYAQIMPIAALASTSMLTGVGLKIFSESPEIGGCAIGMGLLGASVSAFILDHNEKKITAS